MAEKTKKAAAKKGAKKKSWFDGLKSEYRKIIWTDKETLVKQTGVVVAVTVVLAVIISVMDAGILQCINLLIG